MCAYTLFGLHCEVTRVLKLLTSERCIVQIVNVPQRGPSTQSKRGAQTAQAVSEISKGFQCALTAITVVALWQLPHLGHGMCAYTLFGLHCEVTTYI